MSGDTKETFKVNSFSKLAVFETIISVLIYIFIAIYFNTYIHLFISVIIAPFLLLKSDVSVKHELNLFNKLFSLFMFRHKKYDIFLSFLFYFILFYFFSLIAELTISDYIVLRYIFYIIICCLFIYIISDFNDSLNMSQKVCIFLSCFLGLFFGFDLDFLEFILAIVIVLFLMIFFSLKYITMIIKPLLLLVILLLTSLFSKAISIVLSLKSGYKCIVNNWYEYNFVINFHISPELANNIGDDESLQSLKLDNIMALSFLGNDIINKIALRVAYSILYLFTIAYRISIKSTMWFYIPILMIVKSPHKLKNKKIAEFLSYLFQTYIAKVRLFIAVITIVAFIITYFRFMNIPDLELPLFILISTLYIDFSSISFIKIFQLLISVLTFVLFFWSELYYTPKKKNDIPLEQSIQFQFIYYLNNLRNTISLFYFISAIVLLCYYFQIWNYKYIAIGIQPYINLGVDFILYKPFN